MSTWGEDVLDTEYDEYDDGEAYDDADAYDDGEASRADRRKRARRVALARTRAAKRRGGGLPATYPPQAAAQRTARAVRELDLETKVAQDSFRGSVGRLDKNVRYAEYSVAASTLVTAALDNLGQPDNKFLVTGIKASPLLLLLASPRRGRGVGSVLTNPAVIGLAGAFGLAFIGDQRDKSSGVKRLEIVGPTTMSNGQTALFSADVFDGKDRPSGETVTWQSDQPEVVSIDTASGRATAQREGFAIVTATAGGLVRRVGVQVLKGTVGAK
jgi:hypothetical protein